MTGSVQTNRCGHCPGSHTGQLPCLATATGKARGWLLLEHPGPWPESVGDLTGPLAPHIAAAQRGGVRPQLIRRPGKRRATPPFQVYAAWSYGPDVWVEGRELTHPDELGELDLAALGRGERPRFGVPVKDPLLLVCTHGRHNACCARTGVPLARALSGRFGAAVWETSHVGGDRFAANLVCLPYGLYYGNLGEAEAIAAVEAYQNGEVTLDRLRGRAGLPEPAQAAEHHVRAETGLLGLDAVAVESVTGVDPSYEVIVKAAGARYRVIVEHGKTVDPCGPECNESVRSYLIQDLTLLSEAALV